jgi:hypothetical protein
LDEFFVEENVVTLTRLMLAMVSVPPITRPGGTRGRSGKMVCGLTRAIPGSEEDEE